MTMVYGSERLLRLWVAHYGRLVGRQNLIVISHGENAAHREICQGMTHIVLPRVFDATFERDRMQLVMNLSDGFLRAFHAVIFSDVDEFLALDPSVDMTLPDYLRQLPDDRARAPIGLNVIPNEMLPASERADDRAPDLEDDLEAPLASSPNAAFFPFLCKPMVHLKRTMFSHGFHATIRTGKGRFQPDMVLDKNLLQFHLKYLVDYESRYTHVHSDVTRVKEENPNLKQFTHWRDADEHFEVFADRLRNKPHLGELTPQQLVGDSLSIESKEAGFRSVAHRVHAADGQVVGRAFRLPEAYHGLISSSADPA